MLQDEIKNQSVSCATMRPEDLIPSFIDAVKVIDPDNRPLMASMAQLESDMQKDGYFDSEDCQFDLDYLFDTLNMLAPDGFYFGSHPGDGSDYGFWECED